MVMVAGMMGSGDRHLRHHLHGGGGSKRDQHQQPQTPKGCLAVMVGQEGEERQRFVVPVAYLTHPRFVQLLKEAEDEYGFEHKGAITIPCHAAEFRSLQGLIHRELFSSSHNGGGGHHNLVACFRA